MLRRFFSTDASAAKDLVKLLVESTAKSAEELSWKIDQSVETLNRGGTVLSKEKADLSTLGNLVTKNLKDIQARLQGAGPTETTSPKM